MAKTTEKKKPERKQTTIVVEILSSKYVIVAHPENGYHITIDGTSKTLGHFTSLPNCLERIATHYCNSTGETYSLSEYIDTYREIKEEIKSIVNL